ncbi:myrosinase 1-like [Atheta coriaria]|uniref:myrosinase 1-like n=1 Tax=Dalotia coriaria TaxID=877792 RepID=UPI0031F3C637
MAKPTTVHFPKNFKFGVSTSAYQIEGGWNEDGKSESIWDYYTHTFPQRIVNLTSGDISCDSYHKFEEDIANIKRLKVQFYRFSISWCRILPTGHPNKINHAGIDYYNRLINALIQNGIEPVATLFHWDIPLSINNLGGWCNPITSDYFASYARVCFTHFGDRVKTWITINEPILIAMRAYGGAQLAPAYDSKGIGSYLSGHGELLGHMKAYHIYDKEFRAVQKGRIGITNDARWGEPATQTPEDIEAAERYMQMDLGWFAHPIFSKEGDYPLIMRELIDTASKKQGFDQSRLPKFTPEEIQLLKGSSDFFGLNHYNTVAVKHGNTEVPPTNENDINCTTFYDPSWKTNGSDLFRVVPWGFRKLLNWIKNEYNNPEVIVFENGFAGNDTETLNDIDRIDYMRSYMAAMSDAILKDNCRVTGYTFWTLMDNFEWQDGYTVKFGLHHVDFKDPNRKRTPKRSAFVYQDIVVTRCLTNPIPDRFLH